MQDIASWLALHQTDGVNLSIKELLLYQGKAGLLNLSPQRAVQAKLAGAYMAKTKGRGMEFDEARHYQPGDDIRAIDWRVTARTGKTHTKVYREEKERPVFVLTDISSSMAFGTQLLFKSTQAAHLTALIAWAAKKRGDRIGGLAFNNQQHLECKPLTRQKAVLSLLNNLVKLQSTSGPNNEQNNDNTHSKNAQNVTLADACARLRRLAHPGSLIFIISDFSQLNDAAKQHITQMNKHCEVQAYAISDPFEHELPRVSVGQTLSLTDGSQTQQVTLGQAKTEQEYKAAHQSHFEHIQDILKQCQVPVIQVSAAHPLATQLDPLARRSAK